MKIDHPTPVQIPQLRGLWKTAFGDGDEWLDQFFSAAFSPSRCRCVTEDGALLAALYWFDVSCDSAPMAYLYAVATDPTARNRGLCRTLLEDTKEVLVRQGYAGAMLKAADEGLRRMYERMGFRPCTTISEQIFKAGSAAAPLRRIDTAEYGRLRRAFLPAHGVIQDGPLLDFFGTQAELYAGEDFLCAVSVHDGMFHCHELLGNICAAPHILRALNYDRGSFRFPGDGVPFASFCPLTSHCPTPAYFGLALD